MQHATDGNISFLKDKSWWLKSFRAALSFAPACWWPALLLGVANLALLLGVRYLYNSMRVPEMPVQELMKIFAIGCAVALSSVIAMTWAFGSWLLRLTAFAHACMQADRLPSRALWQESLLKVRGQKLYLVKLWAIASVYLLMPAFGMCILTVVKLVQSPMLLTQTAGAALPQPWYVCLLDSAIFGVSAVSTSYSMILLVLSSVTVAAAGETAWSAVVTMANRLIPLLLLGLFVLGFNVLVSTPQIIWAGGALLESLDQNVYALIAWQVWFALSSCVLWPWSVLPYCQFLKVERGG